MQSNKCRDKWSWWWGDWNFLNRKVTWLNLLLARPPGPQDSRAMSLEKERSGAAPAGWPFWDGSSCPDHWPNPTYKQRRVRKLAAYLWVAGLYRKQLTPAFLTEKSIHLSITQHTSPWKKVKGLLWKRQELTPLSGAKLLPIRGFRISTWPVIFRSFAVSAVLYFLC